MTHSVPTITSWAMTYLHSPIPMSFHALCLSAPYPTLYPFPLSDCMREAAVMKMLSAEIAMWSMKWRTTLDVFWSLQSEVDRTHFHRIYTLHIIVEIVVSVDNDIFL